MSKRYILLLLLVTSAFSSSRISARPRKKKNIEKKEYPGPKTFFTPEEREKFDDLVRQGLFYENKESGSKAMNTKFSKELDEEFKKKVNEELEQTENKLRRLSSENLLSKIGFFDVYQNTSNWTEFHGSQKYVIQKSKTEESKFILYPYAFEYEDYDKQYHQSEKGGFFALNLTDLEQVTNFKKLLNISSVAFKKAKAVYDIDIAILSLEYELEGQKQDLFTETSSFCTYFNSFGKISTCLEGIDEYNKYKVNNTYKGTVVRVSHEDIDKGILYDGTKINFKLLIIPDHLYGNIETINSKFTSAIQSKIITYRQKGGNIIASGKSGYLLEVWKMIESGTYNPSKIYERYEGNSFNIKGCEDYKYNTPENMTDFLRQLMCMDVTSSIMIEQMYEMKKIPKGFELIASYAGPSWMKMKERVEGVEKVITNTSLTYPLAVISNPLDNNTYGRICIINAKSVGDYPRATLFRNFMYYAMTRNILFDIKLKFGTSADQEDDLPIPGGEEGVQIGTQIKLFNLFDQSITNVKIALFFLKDIEFYNVKDECSLKNDASGYITDLPADIVNTEKFVLCSVSSIDQLNKFENEFKIEIKSQSVTKNESDISFIFPFLQYTDGESGSTIKMKINPFKAQSKLAAVLRGTLNPDPSGFYPILGKGIFFDNALTVENKENSEALKVNYISVLPLISPIVDGNDERLVSQMLPVFEEYYHKHEYTYPWTDVYNKGVDYVDWVEFANKEVYYTLDFDTPVKLSKVLRTDISSIPGLYIPTGKEEKDDHADGSVRTGSAQLLREIYFGDSEKFYEKASQRRFLHIDTSTEIGASIAFPNGVPKSLQDPLNPKRTKREFGFTRADIFFYGSMFGQYQIPNGLNDSVLLSIDKYNQSKIPVDGTKLGTRQSKKVVEGYFNSSKYDENIPGNTLKPNEYSNVMRQYSFLTKYDPTNEKEMELLQSTSFDKISLTHYLLPFISDDITSAASIKYFKEDSEGSKSGYMEQYPSLRFIYAHLMNVTLSPEVTRIGGKITLKLPVGFVNAENPVDKERITISADNVAFYKTEYDSQSKTITLYFKRGLMPNENAGGDSKCQVYIENLSSVNRISISMTVYNLKYDFTVDGFETYITGATSNITAVYVPFWSFPAVYMENTLYRKSTFENDQPDKIAEYELVNPYARYGIYFQELTKHTTVYGSLENHPIKDPGFVGKSAGFALISNVGTSFVPFAEYLSTGVLNIPGAVSTSRLEWNDVWGRKWVQNLRSVYPDIPPIPPAPLSFLMTTTYELLSDDSKEERLMEWTSDENVNMRIQLKFINTYNKYWEPVVCLKNQFPFVKRSAVDYGNPHELENEIKKLEATECQDGKCDANVGFTRNYGVCYPEGSYLNGTYVDANIAEGMKTMTTCAESNDVEKMNQCSKQADLLDLPQIKKLPNDITDAQNQTPDKKWNYSPEIANYFPQGYTDERGLWTFHKFDYYDDAFYKGYPFHNDNCLPSLDVGINADLAYYKPHNLAAFPIFKGSGYNIEYDSSYTLRNRRYSGYHGWWSDQLQNKDHTLLAGQEKVNEFAVGQSSLISSKNWIHSRQIDNKSNTNLVTERLKNIYVCKYNQHRIKITPGQKKYAWPNNVYQNNVVPVIPSLRDDAPEYTNFNCSGENAYQYDNKNISLVDNRVKTTTIRDWLYFAVAIRGNSKEDINIVMKLKHLGNYARYEGITKIQDGGRFTYWVPVNGPNSFLYNDCPVNTVIAKRIDLQLEHHMYPINLYTFNTDVYELFTIFDEQEENREYTMSTYMNSHGYGDSTVSVYVGGTDGTKCKIEPGEFTYVKIVFYNNAGFDWNMKGNAIVFEESGKTVTFNSDQLMKQTVTNIQFPKKYNFMSYEIPAEIQQYVTLTPALHRVDLAPQFFDLLFDNTVSIKDSLESDYHYCLNITKDFPDQYKGKLWEIKMHLNKEYFERLPGYNDPTGIHDYTLTIPSIRFGVPYNGKVYYVLGQTQQLFFTFNQYKYFDIKGIKIVTDEQAEKLSMDIIDDKNKYVNLENSWNSFNTYSNLNSKITYTSSLIPNNNFFKIYNLSLTSAFPVFPYERQQQPFQTKINVLVRLNSPQVPAGYNNLVQNGYVHYHDGRKLKTTFVNYPNWIQGIATGPWITATIYYEVVKLDTTTGYYIKSSDLVYNGDTKIFNVTFTLKNTGSDISYKNNFEVKLNKNSKIMTPYGVIGDTMKYEIDSSNSEYNLMKIYYGDKIVNGNDIKFELPIRMKVGDIEVIDKTTGNRRLEETTKENQIIKGIDVNLCKTDVNCNGRDINSAKQIIEVSTKINYENESNIIGKIHLNYQSTGTKETPKYKFTAILSGTEGTVEEKDVEFIFNKIVIKNKDTYNTEETTFDNIGNTMEDSPISKDQYKDSIEYVVEYYATGKVSRNGKEKYLSNDNIISFPYYKNEGNKKKLWPIILGVVLGVIILVVGAFLFYKFIYAKMKEKKGRSIKNDSVSVHVDKPSSKNIIPNDQQPKVKNDLILRENKNSSRHLV